MSTQKLDDGPAFPTPSPTDTLGISGYGLDGRPPFNTASASFADESFSGAPAHPRGERVSWISPNASNQPTYSWPWECTGGGGHCCAPVVAAGGLNRGVQELQSREEGLGDAYQRASIAKMEALARKKQIPPFIRKLNRLVEASENDELIRWSDDGNSFIIADGDTFAKTIIPEFFKHNNYASFVRQLNMYGFHKKGRLSMRARKNNRSSSEYCHSYFRRGHPHLLWLIGSQCRRLPLKTERLSKNHALGHNVNKALHDDTQLTQERAQASGNILDGNGPSGFARALDIIRQEQIACTDTMRRLESGSRHLHAMAAEFQELHTRNRNSISAIINHLRHLYDRTPQDHERSPTGAGSNASVILRESGKLSPSSAYLAPSVVCPDRDRSILPQAFRVQSNIQIGTASAANVFAPWKTFSNSGLSRASQYNYIEVGSTNIDSD